MTRHALLSRTNLPSTQPDVAVVGASAAGLYAAYLLARGGLTVSVFDAQEELGTPARTLIVTPYLDTVLGCTPPEIVVNRTGTLRLHSQACSATVRLGSADLIVERERLILWLLQAAESAGVRVHLGYRFAGLEPDGARAVVRLEDALGHAEEVRPRIIIGADGASSELARRISGNGHAQVFLRQAVVPMPSGASETVTQIWFDPAQTKYFFWLIPESRKRAVVGLIAETEEQARTSLRTFMADHRMEAVDYQEAEVPCYSWNSRAAGRVGGTRIFLVGDAAAQVKMTTVGGVVTGLWGAQAAARCILRGTPYLQASMGLRKELTVHALLRRVLNRFTAEDYDDLLMLLNRVAHGPVAYITRDEAARLLWRVGVTEPRFALVTAKALLGRRIAWSQRRGISLRESRVR